MGDIVDIRPYRIKRENQKALKKQFMGYSFKGEPVHIAMPPQPFVGETPSWAQDLIKRWAQHIENLKNKPTEP